MSATCATCYYWDALDTGIAGWCCVFNKPAVSNHGSQCTAFTEPKAGIRKPVEHKAEKESRGAK